MKKKIMMVMVACVLSVAALTGCGSAPEDASAEVTTAEDKKVADSSVLSGNEKYDEIKSTLTKAYAGTTDTNKIVYYVVNDDNTRAILCMKENVQDVDPHAVMLIGDITDNGDGIYTLLDASTWQALTFKLSVTEEMGEEAYTITFNGINDVAQMFPSNPESVFDKISEF